jgi:endoglucanase
VLGVIAAKPPHFLAASERDKVLKLDKMRIDIGATSGDDVRDTYGIEVGDTIVPDSPFTPMANPDVFVAKAFDDRLGLGLTIETMEQLKTSSLPNTIYCVGSVQEEVGVRGAQTAAQLVKPDVAIVVEAPPADDQPEVAADERQGIMGGGPQLRMMDPTAISNRRLVDFIVDTAKNADIPLQLAVRRSGGTDAKAIHLSGIGVPTVVLGVPTRYIHTHNSMVNINDYINALKLLTTLVPKLTQDVVDSFTDFSSS